MRSVLILSLLTTGCTSINPESIDLPISLLNNRASMKFEAQGKKFSGTATLQRQAGIGTEIKFNLPKGTILFQLDNCAREHVKIRPDGNTYTYHYNPSIFKEAEDSCIMQIQATTYKGEIQTAIIDFTDSRRLHAKLWCNEDLGVEQTGVAFCQNRNQKLMWIDFDEEVVWATTDDCVDPMTPKYHREGFSYEILIQEGLCAYSFMSKGREKFRLTTYGYSTIREVNLEAEKAGR